MPALLRCFACALALAVTCFGAVPQASAQAAETSSADAEISLSLSGRVWLTRLSDIDLGTYGGTGSLTGRTRMCVYRNDTGIYNLTATSANAADGSFRAAADGEFLPYQVAFRDHVGNTFDDIRSGQRLTGLQGLNFALLCLLVRNAQLEVNFDEADLQAASPGRYLDVITLLVEPG